MLTWPLKNDNVSDKNLHNHHVAVPFCQIKLKASKPQIPPYPPYPSSLETLGDWIRKRRLDLKLTAKELGKILGVDQDTIYSWEYHRTSPNPRRLPGIIRFLGQEPGIKLRKFYGERILAFRKSRGLSRKQLAEIISIQTTTLRQWETDQACPSRLFLDRLLLILDVTAQEGIENF